MAEKRENPFGSFNFRVTADKFGDADSILAGFQEVSGLGMEVTIAEYRNGNEKENHVRKINGIYKANDVTLKRGVVGSADFFSWIIAVGNGAQGDEALNTVTISLMDETGEDTVMSWKLTNARPIKYTAPGLNAKGGGDVAIEELVLACEKMTAEE